MFLLYKIAIKFLYYTYLLINNTSNYKYLYKLIYIILHNCFYFITT